MYMLGTCFVGKLIKNLKFVHGNPGQTAFMTKHFDTLVSCLNQGLSNVAPT